MNNSEPTSTLATVPLLTIVREPEMVIVKSKDSETPSAQPVYAGYERLAERQGYIKCKKHDFL